MSEPHPHCTWVCRVLGLELAHTVRRTTLEVSRRIRSVLDGETLTGL